MGLYNNNDNGELQLKLSALKGVDLIDQKETDHFKGYLVLNELMSKECYNLIFRNVNNDFLLKFNEAIYSFRKVPLFSNGIAKLLNYNSFSAYIILSYKDGLFYIGSSKSILDRMYKHRDTLKKKINKNKRLQDAFDNSTEKHFHVITIHVGSQEGALDLEQLLLNHFKDNVNKTNVSENSRDSTKFKSFSEDVSKRMKVYHENPAVREKRSASMKAKHAEPGYKEKISEAYKKYWSKEENREKARASIAKKYADPVLAQKRSEAMRERVLLDNATTQKRKQGWVAFRNDEVKYNLTKEKRNQSLSSPETRAKMSESGKKRMSDMSVRLAHSEKIKTLMTNQKNRDRLRVALKDKCKPVIIDGVIFDSLNLAAQHFNLSKPGLRHRVESDNAKFKDWNYYIGARPTIAE